MPDTPKLTYSRSFYQIFCGRLEESNIIFHKGDVFRRMLDHDWLGYKKSLGVTDIYLLGVWDNRGNIIVSIEEGSPLSGEPHRVPSPFAISNHVKIHPDLGTIDDFALLVNKLHSFGFRVIVDFVPNHTGLAHDWLRLHPDYYKKDQMGNVLSAFSGDVAVLDYENHELCEEMIQVLLLIQSLDVDGVRCDMAHLIPSSFWTSAITRVKSVNSNFTFIAEAYTEHVFDHNVLNELLTAGFDFVYDEHLYRNFKISPFSLENVVGHLRYISNCSDKDHWLHYLMNHDDSLILNEKSVYVWQALLLLLPGGNFFYNGMFGGQTTRLAHHFAQLLPQEHSSLSKLPLSFTSWIEWCVQEQPRIASIDIVSDHVISLHWLSEKSHGLACFVLGETGYDWSPFATSTFHLEAYEYKMVVV